MSPARTKPQGARPRWSCNLGRVAAAKALMAIEEGDHHLEDELAARMPKDPRDRGLAWFLAFGVVRHRGEIDAALQSVCRQPIGGLEPGVRAVLRLGAFEKRHGRAQAHAVVHEAVEVARAVGVGRASGLVNAVMRRVPTDGFAHDNHPAWLVERWQARYGVDATAAWLVANGEPPPVFIVAPKGLPDGLVADDVGEGVYRLGEEGEGSQGMIAELPGFAQGAFWVQDLAAVRVADLLAKDLAPGSRVLDACAAPGGKSFRIASHGHGVMSIDRDEQRLAMVRESAHRLGFPLAFRAHDWLTGPMEGLGTFDAVLVDAPCSGLGTVRRHPEIRWKRQPHELDEASDRQGRILAACATHVAPGGVLVHAVCSPEPEEGQQVVDAFLAGHPDFTLESTLHTAPPSQGEDAHAAFRMRRAG